MGSRVLDLKRTSWVELYFDLVFVLAIAQVSHVLAERPDWQSLGLSLGLFAVLWWTWIGFAVFYNRYGDDTSTWQRLMLIGATIPCGLAAVAVNDVAHGERTPFTLSLAGVRLLLAAAYLMQQGKRPTRIAVGYAASAVVLVLTAPLPNPWWWLVWIAVITSESIYVFGGDRFPQVTVEQAEEINRDWRKALAWYRPTDPENALNVPHLSERFGLFALILLGEVVASAGQRVLGGTNVSWLSLSAVIALAGALWWTYFDATEEDSERLLEMAGGSAKWARSAFAVGRMLPAYALVVIAAGLRLLLEGEPGQTPYWLVSVGLGAYLLGIRVDQNSGLRMWLRLSLICLTFGLGVLGRVLSPPSYLWVVVGWAVLCAYVVSRGGRALRSELGPQQAGQEPGEPAEDEEVAEQEQRGKPIAEAQPTEGVNHE